MKNSIMILTGIAVGVLTIMVVMTVMGRMNHFVELESQISGVAEETVKYAMLHKDHSQLNRQEFLAITVQNVAAVIQTKTDIVINIFGADERKGMLGMNIVERFKHPNEKEGTVNSDRTVIFNQLPKEKHKVYEVSFYLNSGDILHNRNCYKKISVLEGETVPAPKEPTKAQQRFVGWLDASGYVADFSQPVSDHISFYAEWE